MAEPYRYRVAVNFIIELPAPMNMWDTAEKMPDLLAAGFNNIGFANGYIEGPVKTNISVARNAKPPRLRPPKSKKTATKKN